MGFIITEEMIEKSKLAALDFIKSRDKRVNEARNEKMLALAKFVGCMWCDCDDPLEKQIDDYVKHDMKEQKLVWEMNKVVGLLNGFYHSLGDEEKELVAKYVMIDREDYKFWPTELQNLVNTWRD